MSVIETSSIKNSAGMIGYLFYGRRAQVKENYRARAVFCNTSLQILKEKADILQKTKHVAPFISIIQSFNNEQDHLDFNSKKDCRYVNDLGVKLANRLYPDSDCLVVTHNDGTNNELHNHIIVLNYDYKLKHALRKNRNLYKMRHVNDELMREHGLSVVKKSKNLEKTTFETKRIVSEDKNWREHDFDTILKTKINSAKKSSKSFDDFTDLLGKADVEVKIRKSKAGKVGLTFKMKDSYHYKKVNGKKVLAPRMRRRKSSKLGTAFSYESILQACRENKLKLDKLKQEKEKLRKQAQIKLKQEQHKASKAVTIKHIDVSKYIKVKNEHKREKSLLHEDDLKKKSAFSNLTFAENKNDVFSKENLNKKDKNNNGIDDEKEGFTYNMINDVQLEINNEIEHEKQKKIR